MELYTVQSGDTLAAIAARFGVDAGRLAADNGIPDAGTLVPGQSLVILRPLVLHTVAPGESLFSIAVRYTTTVNQLLRNNPALGGRTEVTPGQKIAINFDAERIGTFVVTGYAYPYVLPDVLRRTLPYLTYLALFSYGIAADGGLLPLDDARPLALAREYGVSPILMISALTEDGTFSSERAGALFRDPAARTRYLNEVAETMRAKGYVGLDIDFEFVLPEDAENFAVFVNEAAALMRENGWFTVVSLAPKTSADQPGLLYEAHNYAALGGAADYVLLMTYEWGYGLGPPLPVAPLNKVAEVLAYGLTELPPEKITLGIPNYGYDWPLPYVRGVSATTSIGNEEAVALAVRVGAEIGFDPVAQSPFFFYTENGVEHEVWFEDARSVAAKFNLAAENRLRGLGYWNVMRPFQANWSLLNAIYTIRRA